MQTSYKYTKDPSTYSGQVNQLRVQVEC